MAVLARHAGEVPLDALSLGLRSTDKRAVNRFHATSITYIGCPGNKKGTAEAAPVFPRTSQARSEGGIDQDLHHIRHADVGESEVPVGSGFKSVVVGVVAGANPLGAVDVEAVVVVHCNPWSTAPVSSYV